MSFRNICHSVFSPMTHYVWHQHHYAVWAMTNGCIKDIISWCTSREWSNCYNAYEIKSSSRRPLQPLPYKCIVKTHRSECTNIFLLTKWGWRNHELLYDYDRDWKKNETPEVLRGSHKKSNKNKVICKTVTPFCISSTSQWNECRFRPRFCTKVILRLNNLG